MNYPPMSPSSSSSPSPAPPSHACWTCHLRKKKCSGGSPSCMTCEQLNIQCYGYGEKPSWMNGGEAEKRKIEEIRKGVKVTTDSLRRSRALQALSKRTVRKRSSMTGKAQPLHEVVALFVDVGKDTDGNTAVVCSSHPSWEPDENLKLLLLMHYLDHVFPLLFPFYKPPIEHGGRGWILGLLKQTKPVHDAALSLAACHRQLVLRDVRPRNYDSGVQQQMYALALQGLRDNIEVILSKTPGVDGLKDSIDIFACIIHLILLEGFQGGTENWLKHLRIAPDLIKFLQIYCEPEDTPKNPVAPAPTSILTPLPTPPLSRSIGKTVVGVPASHIGLSLVDHSSVHFFSSALIWFDILAATSTRRPPQYASICAAALGDWDSSIQLQDIMGCENWAMILIRDIAILDAWKIEMRSHSALSMRELASRAAVLEQKLKNGISMVSNHLSNLGSARNGERNSSLETLLITQAFASAAVVYLHTTVSGANPAVLEIAVGVQQTLVALKALPSTLMRSAVWPLCIAGCMAAPAEELSWRNFIDASGMKSMAEAFGSFPRAWEVVETCWKLRKDEKTEMGKSYESDWTTAMQTMGYRVLLI